MTWAKVVAKTDKISRKEARKMLNQGEKMNRKDRQKKSTSMSKLRKAEMERLDRVLRKQGITD